MHQKKDVKITLFKPHEGQIEILKLIHDPKNRYIVIPCGRRFGKTELALNVMTYYALKFKNMQILYLTPTGDQRSNALSDYVVKFGDAPFIQRINRYENIVSFYTNSKIYFKLGSFPSVESIRGRKFDILVLDEFAMYNKDVFETILQPTLATQKNFKCIFLSTPRGQGQFYEFYKRGLDPSYENWVSYRASSDKNPLVQKDFLEDVRRTIPEKIYRQEYEAEFIADSGALFENVDLCSTAQTYSYSKNTKYFAGVDLGFQHDFCVVNIMDEHGNVVDWDRFNQVTLGDAAKRIFNFLKKWGEPITYIENNQYQGVFEMIQKLGYSKLHGFNTNTQTKKEIIEGLIDSFQQKTIRVPANEIYKLELLEFGYVYNPKTRNVSYKGLGEHDDIVMSLAITNWVRKKYTKGFVYGFL